MISYGEAHPECNRNILLLCTRLPCKDHILTLKMGMQECRVRYTAKLMGSKYISSSSNNNSNNTRSSSTPNIILSIPILEASLRKASRNSRNSIKLTILTCSICTSKNNDEGLYHLNSKNRHVHNRIRKFKCKKRRRKCRQCHLRKCTIKIKKDCNRISPSLSSTTVSTRL